MLGQIEEAQFSELYQQLFPLVHQHAMSTDEVRTYDSPSIITPLTTGTSTVENTSSSGDDDIEDAEQNTLETVGSKSNDVEDQTTEQIAEVGSLELSKESGRSCAESHRSKVVVKHQVPRTR